MVADDEGRVWAMMRTKGDDPDKATVYWIIDVDAPSVHLAVFDGRVRVGSVSNGRAYGVLRTEAGEQFVVRYVITGAGS